VRRQPAEFAVRRERAGRPAQVLEQHSALAKQRLQPAELEAVCREAQFGNWYYWDFAPKNLNAAWKKQWFDYPDMAFTNENLFVTFNVFLGNAWERAVVFRFPLATAEDTGRPA